MADCKSGCTAACKSDCNNTCKDKCKNTCTGICENSCNNDCYGGCEGGCESRCYTGCYTGCYNGCTNGCNNQCRTGCKNNCLGKCKNTCDNGCTGNCYTGCNTTCYSSCVNVCKDYCASICQTYCQKAQTFTENLASKNVKNPIGKEKFIWSNLVKGYNSKTNEQGSTIIITAKEWNILKKHIQAATKYCGGTAPSGPDASNDPESPDSFISAEKYKDLAKGLGITDKVVAGQTIISADLINKLSDTYNKRQINNTYPIKNSNTKNKDNCCQKGQNCMKEGQLLSHQGKTEKCKNQNPSVCGNQNKINSCLHGQHPLL